MRALLFAAVMALQLTNAPAWVLTRPRARTSRATLVMSREVTFRAGKEICSAPFEPAQSSKRLTEWFDRDDALYTLFGAAEKVERCGEVYCATVPLGTFPGIVVKSVSYFEVERLPEGGYDLTCLNSSSTATGPRFLVRIFDAVQGSAPPRTTSTNVLTLKSAEGGAQYFSSKVELSISLSVPSWIPIGTATMEKQGSKALDKMLDSDVAPLIEKFKDKYADWLVA